MPLTIEDILRRDLTTDPPPGLPALNERAAKCLKLRISHPEYSDAQCIRDAGYPSHRRADTVLGTGRVWAYRSALAQAGASPNQDMSQIDTLEPTRLRYEMVAKLTAAMDRPDTTGRDLAYIVQVLDRVVPVPPPAPEIVERADKMTVSTLETMLGECLQRIDRMRTATRKVQVVDVTAVTVSDTVNP